MAAIEEDPAEGRVWLHVRLDTRPKYYRTRAYADPEYWTRRPTGGSSRAR